jgi:acyl-CoA reductase-like NAD-dependent aldehyde dehydrogenase
MKTKIYLLLAVVLAGTMTVNAQGGFQRRTVEERVTMAHAKLDSAFKLDATTLSKVDAEFTAYYKAQDAKREELSGTDRETRMAEMKKLADARDEKLKKIFTEEQFKKWKDEIEPLLRPQRPSGGGGNNR